MSKLFIAGVGVAELYEGEKLFLTSNTLLDSSITIGVQQEELRGGGSNALWGLYFHDTSFSMKLTDIMFNMQYIAANVGTEMVRGGDVFKNESDVTVAADGTITLDKTAVPFKNGGDVIAFIRKSDSVNSTYTKVKVNAQNKITGLAEGDTYCVRYMYNDSMASKLLVSSQFIPKTLYAILTANLYAGDDKNPTTGTLVGSLTIKIPRFQLNGAMELSMTSSGFSNSGMEGYALATDATGCDGKGIYAEIVQVLYDERWYTNATEIYFGEADKEFTAGTQVNITPELYVEYPATEPWLINNEKINTLEDGVPAAEKTMIKYDITAGGTGLSINQETGAITGSATAGTATYTATAVWEAKEGTPAIPQQLVAVGTIKVVASAG